MFARQAHDQARAGLAGVASHPVKHKIVGGQGRRRRARTGRQCPLQQGISDGLRRIDAAELQFCRIRQQIGDFQLRRAAAVDSHLQVEVQAQAGGRHHGGHGVGQQRQHRDAIAGKTAEVNFGIQPSLHGDQGHLHQQRCPRITGQVCARGQTQHNAVDAVDDISGHRDGRHTRQPVTKVVQGFFGDVAPAPRSQAGFPVWSCGVVPQQAGVAPPYLASLRCQVADIATCVVNHGSSPCDQVH